MREERDGRDRVSQRVAPTSGEGIRTDQSTTGGVDQDSGGLHQLELLSTDHAARLVEEGAVQADDVGLCEQLVERADARVRNRGQARGVVLGPACER